MSTSQLNPFSLPASGDLSASVFCAVTVNTSGQAALPSAGGSIVGVIYNKPTALGQAAVIYGPGTGIVKAVYGGTVTAKDPLKVNASGQFITASATDNAVAIAVTSGASGEIGQIVLFGGASAETGGEDDIVLGTTAPSASSRVTYVQTTATVTGALGSGLYVGQMKDIVQSVAASTPVGTITGAFKNQAGAAKTTLALGTAVAWIGSFVWDGAAWRQVSTLGGTGSSLS